MSNVLAENLMLTELTFFSPILYPFWINIIRLPIFKFLSSISYSHVRLVIIPKKRNSLPSIGNDVTHLAYNRFFYLMMILHAVSD